MQTPVTSVTSNIYAGNPCELKFPSLQMQIYQNTKVCISITLQLSLTKSASVAEKRINRVFMNPECIVKI